VYFQNNNKSPVKVGSEHQKNRSSHNSEQRLKNINNGQENPSTTNVYSQRQATVTQPTPNGTN
jgi:hypothetical protein